ncbi:MAG: DUF4292 domain-containing protein [Bacteroidales bacterium]|nr:DUF4292 domain-containing protein [Bacteroidales bacterium]
MNSPANIRYLYSYKNFLTTAHWYCLVSLLILIASCKTHRSVIKEPIKDYGADYIFEKLKENELKFNWFSAKYTLELLLNKKKTSFSGQVRMRKDSAIWVTLSPALGIEMARLLITNDSVKFINRINKTYFEGDYGAINRFLDTNIDFDVIQSILLGNDLTYYEDGKFRVSYDSKEYHLVTAGRSKLKKYSKTREDEERIFIQNIFLNPETFKITQMKIKEVKKENKKLDAFYSDFQTINGQLFPQHIFYEIDAENPVVVDVDYSRISLNEKQNFPFKISTKYDRLQ